MIEKLWKPTPFTTRGAVGERKWARSFSDVNRERWLVG